MCVTAGRDARHVPGVLLIASRRPCVRQRRARCIRCLTRSTCPACTPECRRRCRRRSGGPTRRHRLQSQRWHTSGLRQRQLWQRYSNACRCGMVDAGFSRMVSVCDVRSSRGFCQLGCLQQVLQHCWTCTCCRRRHESTTRLCGRRAPSCSERRARHGQPSRRLLQQPLGCRSWKQQPPRKMCSWILRCSRWVGQAWIGLRNFQS